MELLKTLIALIYYANEANLKPINYEILITRMTVLSVTAVCNRNTYYVSQSHTGSYVSSAPT